MIRAAVVLLALLVARTGAAVAPPLPSSSPPSPSLPTASSPSLSPSGAALPSLQPASLPSSTKPSSSPNPSLSTSSKPSLTSSSNPSLPSLPNPSLPASPNPALPSSSNPSLPSASNPSLPSSSNPPLPASSKPLPGPAPKPPTAPTSSKPGSTLSSSPQESNLIPCTDAEKTCFRHDRVYYPPHKKCYRSGTQGPCEVSQQFVALRDPLTSQYAGQCRQLYTCKGQYMSLSKSGPCFKATWSKSDPQWLTCPNDPTKFLQKNNFDDESACCVPDDCRRPRERVVQPDTPGKCAVPNVKVYTIADNYPFVKNPLREKVKIPCDKDEQKCFALKKLYMNGRCYRPLAPCGGGTSWVVVDKATFEKESRLKATCVKSRCPPARVFFGEENRCRSVWELQSVLCAGDEVVFDLFGTAHCGRGVNQANLITPPEPPTASTTSTTPGPPSSNLRPSASRRSTTTPRTPGLSGSLDECTWPPIDVGAFGAPFGSGAGVPSHGSNNHGIPGLPTYGSEPGV